MSPAIKVINTWAIGLLVCLALLILASPDVVAANLTAQATLSDPSGQSALSGDAFLAETPKGLLIQASLKNAPPGLHGFHIHARGSCADGGNGAGGHFNPDNVQHGKLVVDGFANAHAGDLGNFLIGIDGTGVFKQTVSGLTLQGEKYAIADRALILHAQQDDFGQPTGNAGGRIGCGVISLDP